MSRQGKHRSRGQAMVEFALVAPVFFLLLFAIVEGGRFIFFYELLNNATREGARYAIVHGGNSSEPSGPPAPDTATIDLDHRKGIPVLDAAKNAAVGLIGVGDLCAGTSCLPAWWDCASTPPQATDPDPKSTGNNGRGQCVTVFLDYTYRTIIPILPPLTISAESTLVINN